MKNLFKKLELVWNSKVPKILFYGVWAFLLAGFLIHVAQFSFLGLNYYGLPRYPDFWIFWLLATSCLLIGYLLKINFVLYFVAFLPLIYSINMTGLFKIGNFPVHAFDFLAVGCFLGLLPKKHRFPLKTDWFSFLVGCFGCVIFISSAYSLIHPSFKNSISIIFSNLSWNGEYNEFNGVWMGHNVLIGCFLYIFSVNAYEVKFSLSNAIKAQFFVLLVCIVIWLVYLYITKSRFTFDGGVTAIPSAPKHDLAGLLILFFGFFFGMSIYNSKIKFKESFNLVCAFVTVIFIFLSAARSALVVIPAILALGIIIAEKRKQYFLMASCLVALALSAVVLIVRADIMISFAAISSITSGSIFTDDINFLARIRIWENALKIFLSHPICGTGLGSSTSLFHLFSWNGFLGTLDWRVYADVNAQPTLNFLTTHNFYNTHSDLLEIAASTGLIGLVLFLTITIFSIWGPFYKLYGNGCSDRGLLCGLCLALVGYFIFSLADTRIISFLGSFAMWQFIALGVSVSRNGSSVIPASNFSLWPAAMPVLYAICVGVVLAGNYLPANRTYGVWNWNMRDSEGRFLLAKEAQFVVPPFEELEGLSLRLPEESTAQEMTCEVQFNDQKPFILTVSRNNDVYVPVPPPGNQIEWRKVKIITANWAGRGALGFSFGVKPYAIVMTKVRPESYKGIPNVDAAEMRDFFLKK